MTKSATIIHLQQDRCCVAAVVVSACVDAVADAVDAFDAPVTSVDIDDDAAGVAVVLFLLLLLVSGS